jgi:hypothetical protein
VFANDRLSSFLTGAGKAQLMDPLFHGGRNVVFSSSTVEIGDDLLHFLHLLLLLPLVGSLFSLLPLYLSNIVDVLLYQRLFPL